ncbi:intradiol ring-cleavage dioxygenase [Streptomyces sp. NPDC002033]|uniref:dioxygenase family protein n=1 Tax=unclassified Streptomyces TaxID=2593676 RepID=UPI0033183584
MTGADSPSPVNSHRRTLLLAVPTTAVAALASACAGRRSGPEAAGRAPAGRAGTPGPSGPSPACVLAAETGEGPYYTPKSRHRSDVTEDRVGVPLRLDLHVVRASKGCAPLAEAAVDIWHADASGIYSQDGATYLRGTQTTDGQGRVSFRTIVPGWYAHIAPHVHFKVRTGKRAEVSSQLFLPEELLKTIYARQPYSRRKAPAHPNTRDDRFAAKGAQLTLNPVPDGAGYRASFVIGIA